MPRYLVESEHAAEDCERLIREFFYHGYLHHFDWGCKDHVHTGWAIIEADNKDHALMAVPTLLRPKARVVQLVKFSKEKKHEE